MSLQAVPLNTITIVEESNSCPLICFFSSLFHFFFQPLNFLMVLQAIPVNAVTIVEEKSHIFVDKNQTTALKAAFVTVS